MIFDIVRPKLEEKFTSSLKYTIPVVPGQDSDTVTLKVPILSDQNTSIEELCYWIRSFQDVMELKGASDIPQALFNNVKLLLSGDARIDFQEAKKEILGDDNPTITRFRNVMNEWKRRRGFKINQAERVREDLYAIRKPDNMEIKTFANRINEINSYLPLLLSPGNDRMSRTEITAIIKRCNPVYYDRLIENSVLSQDLDLRQIVEYYSNLEDLEKKHIRQQNKLKSRNPNHNDQLKTDASSKFTPSQSSNFKSQRKPAEARLPADTDETYCKYHKTHSHGWNRCRKNLANQNTNNNSNNSPSEETNNIEESQELLDNNSGIIRDEVEDSDEEFYNMEVEEEKGKESESDSLFVSHLSDSSNTHRNLLRIVEFDDKVSDKAEDFTPEVLCLVCRSIATDEKKPFRSLLDTGTSTSILVENSLPEFLRKYCVPDPTGNKTWHTKAGTFTTSKAISLHLQLPQFHLHEPILFTFKVDSTSTKSPTTYPFIMGRDILIKLGIHFNFNSNPPIITCNNTSINMIPTQKPWTRGGKEKQSLLLTVPYSTLHTQNQQISNLSIVRLPSYIAIHLKLSKIIANFHPINQPIEDANAALTIQPT